MSIDQVCSGEEVRRYSSNSRMSNLWSDVDYWYSDPLGSLWSVDIRSSLLITQLTGNGSWSDTWPLLVLCLRLSIELEPSNERTHGDISKSLETYLFRGFMSRGVGKLQIPEQWSNEDHGSMDPCGKISTMRFERSDNIVWWGLMCLTNVIQGYVDLQLRFCVSPIFGQSTDPLFLLEHDMCHPLMRTYVTPGPRHVSGSRSFLFGQRGWWCVQDFDNLGDFGRSIVERCSTSITNDRTTNIRRRLSIIKTPKT